MRASGSRRIAGLIGLAGLVVLTGCGLPRTGPSESEIRAQGDETTLPFEIVPVTDAVARLSTRDEGMRFQEAFRRSPPQNVNLIGPGDSIAVTVWENVGPSNVGVLTAVGQKFALLQETQVDQDGFIFMPYVGRLRAAGNSPEALRRMIAEGLKDQTPDPQVEVRRLQTRSATVSVIGSVATPGILPIEAATRRLLPMLSRAGGVTVEPEVAIVTLRRGRLSGRVWLQDIYDHPEFNVPLRAHDQIIVERDRRAFTALGALGSQRRVAFPSRDINALEALGLVGGLNTQISNPTGIFVFRTEPVEVARAVIADKDIVEPQRVVYTIDLTRPGGLFTAKSFGIRDGDVIYVTEAPLVRWLKVLQAVAPVVNFANSATNLTNL